MTEEYTMPKLGHVMEEGKIVAWHKQVGEPFNKGELFLEIETEKAVLEVEAPFAGTMLEILVGPEETVPIGTPLARVEREGGT